MPDSPKFMYYHWIRGYINHARAEIARVGISKAKGCFKSKKKILLLRYL